MITTKAGVPVRIVGGSKKSITGTRPFEVEVANAESFPSAMRLFSPSRRGTYFGKFLLTKNELNFDSETELYEALKISR